MATTWLNRVYWSAVADPEDWSSPDAGYIEVIEHGGAISGLKALGDLLFVFQEKVYTVYQYQEGDVPIYKVKTFEHGCAHDRTIIDKDGTIYYLSDVGDLRRTNGHQDDIISTKIRPLTLDILKERTLKDYYSGTAPSTVPNAFYDKVNNAYRLFYAGSPDAGLHRCNKCLSYFFDKDVFTTASSIYVGASINIFGFSENIAMIGNSNASGVTNYLVPDYADGDKQGTWDLGWIFSGNPKNNVKVYNLELWIHAEDGDAIDNSEDCDCTITATIYKDPSSSTALKTFSKTITYNGVADNLQKMLLPINTTAPYVRIVLSDSGTNRNYSIEKAIIKFNIMQGKN